MTIHAHSRDSASIRDVAKLANVSHQTVSRVLNGHPNVRPATRQRVLDAVAELRFRPNRAARMLATNRSYTVGVLMTASHAYYGPSSVMSAIEDAARDSGYSVLLARPRDTEVAEFSAAVDHLIHEGVEGIVVVAPQIRAAEAMMTLREPVPVVMIQCEVADPGLSVDNEVGGELAAQHLWELGHRRIALVAGPADWSESGARTRGFERFLASVGAQPVAAAGGDWSSMSGYNAFGHLADTAFTGVFCANDQMALGFIHAAFDHGINVPTGLSVVGFDDVPEAAHYLPPLTTIHQDFDVLGRRAVDRLLSAMQQDANAATDEAFSLRPQLIVRKSTIPPVLNPPSALGSP
ncbi:LacI family DNA-binding transcriptional regulator [Leekyejoonella antrihumi]|uniref:LacI family DNA-binding transcriptional regulator n=1 Tax=Leekyejoonella antrihumi TaxID=1660198 RepID=UPI0016445F20|nr:LacI family DNA-binding transcriptional regulator [Leekyejoonella antrihumi]